MKFIDEKNKTLKWWNRNYFFAGTFVVIAINILLFVILGNHFINEEIGGYFVWYKLDFSNLLRGFLNVFEHADFEHVLLNMLCFLVCGLYIERKTGTLGFLSLIFGFCILDSAFSIATSFSVYYHGASGLIYMCYAYILIDYIFSFHKKKRSKTNTILGGVVLGFIWCAMCFDVSASGFPFTYYPIDLITNAGHYSSFLGGLIVSLMIQIPQICILKNSEPVVKESKKVSMKIYICPIILIVLILISCSTLSILAANNKEYTISFDCNIDRFDKSINYNINDGVKSLESKYIYDYRNSFEIKDREGYFCEIYEDENYTKEPDGLLFTPEINFVPLACTNKTYYVKMIEGYEVYIPYDKILKYFVDYNIISENLNKSIYAFGGQGGWLTLYVEKGQNCSFKMPQPKPGVDVNKLSLYVNGSKIEQDSNAYYTIENVSNDINVVFEYAG